MQWIHSSVFSRGSGRPCAALLAGVCLLAPAAAGALEKTSVRMQDDREDWGRAATCQILYYNLCQQWVWVWSGWDPTDKFGTVFSTDCCMGSATQNLTDFFIWAPTPSPSGYGFTGTLEVAGVDGQDCPTGVPLVSQPFLPAVSGWNTVTWSGSPVDLTPTGGTFAVTYTLANSAQPDPVAFGSDHPLAGPTGPALATGSRRLSPSSTNIGAIRSSTVTTFSRTSRRTNSSDRVRRGRVAGKRVGGSSGIGGLVARVKRATS